MANENIMMSILTGSNGTVKLHGTDSYDGRFKAVYFSEAAEINAISDLDGNDRDDYFTDTTYTVNATEMLVAKNVSEGKNEFISIDLTSGSALIIL